MSNSLQVANQNQVEPLDPQVLQSVLLGGDLSRLTATQKVAYYNKVCETLGLNPLTKPFDYLKLNGKEVLYANKGCAEQLREIKKIGFKVREAKQMDELFIVVTDSLGPDGRTDSATGVVNIAGLRGEALANAMMKAETKSKRRCTLSHCGLNMLDESEIADVSDNLPMSAALPQPSDEEQAEARSKLGYTFPFGSFKFRTPKDAFAAMGKEKLINAMNLIDEKLINGTTYKGVTTEQMIEAKNQIEKVNTDFENSVPFDVNQPAGFVVKPYPHTFKSTEEDVPF